MDIVHKVKGRVEGNFYFRMFEINGCLGQVTSFSLFLATAYAYITLTVMI